MSSSDAAAAFRTTWENVLRSVEMPVQWGLQPRSLDGIESLGIDELYWSRRHQYLTGVYQIDAGAKRRLWIGKKRTLKTLLRLFRWFGPKRSQALRFICSDEDLRRFWSSVSPYGAGVFLDRWCTRVMRSRLEPMKRWPGRCAATASSSSTGSAPEVSSRLTVEDLTGKVRVITKRACGFRTYRAVEVALYYNLGRLPEPDFTHRFC